MLFALIPLEANAADRAARPDMPDQNATIRENVEKADLIVVGRITAVGPPPPAWSGMFAAWQRVDYRIMRWLKKPDKEEVRDTIPVFHLVVAGAPTADPASPRLNPRIFRPGAELILFLREVNDRYEVFDEHLGAMPNEAKWLRPVETALTAAPARP